MRSLYLCAVAIGLAVTLSPQQTRAQKEKGAGLTVESDADAKDIGLPLYPGSRRHKEKDDDSPGLNFGLWGSGSGVKLAVLKMESDDPLDKVASYYKKKLSKYGAVLDCTHASGSDEKESDKSEKLTCGSDKPDKGGVLFKAGSKSDQHIVAIQPAATGSLYQLVHVAHWEK